jgi:hypothetical protein
MLPSKEGGTMADTTTGERERLPLTLSGLSDDEAYNRVVAARTARRFPVVLDLLAAGDVHLRPSGCSPGS